MHGFISGEVLSLKFIWDEKQALGMSHTAGSLRPHQEFMNKLGFGMWPLSDMITT